MPFLIFSNVLPSQVLVQFFLSLLSLVRSLRHFGDDLFSSWYLDKDSIGGSIFYLKSILWAHLYYFNFFDLAISQAIPKAWTSSHVYAIHIAVEVLLKMLMNLIIRLLLFKPLNFSFDFLHFEGLAFLYFLFAAMESGLKSQ